MIIRTRVRVVVLPGGDTADPVPSDQCLHAAVLASAPAGLDVVVVVVVVVFTSNRSKFRYCTNTIFR